MGVTQGEVIAIGPEPRCAGAATSCGGCSAAAAIGAAGDTQAERQGGAAGRDAAGGVPEPTGDEPALGARLNDEGFALINSGEPERAVSVLERAVCAFPPGTDDVNYAFALYNLGHALRWRTMPVAPCRCLRGASRSPTRLGSFARSWSWPERRPRAS